MGLKSDYGSLDLRIEDRAAFIDDAQRLLGAIGESLKDSGVITDHLVRHKSSTTIGFAGEIIGNYIEPQRRFAVTLVFSHTPDAAKTRPDGVAGYALYRRTRPRPNSTSDEPGIDPITHPEDRRPLYGTYPQALIHQVQSMLADHPLNPAAPPKQATG